MAAPFEAGFSRCRRQRQSFCVLVAGEWRGRRQAERLAAGGVKDG
jgi:hypothetical protein